MLITTGLAFEVPAGLDAQLRPRSGLARQGVLSTFGTLDADYRGELMIALYTTSPGVEYTVLISIAHLALDGDVSVSAVAAHLRLTGAFITTVVQRLQVLGLVDKRTDPKDRRRVVLSVTAEGRARLERLAPR